MKNENKKSNPNTTPRNTRKPAKATATPTLQPPANMSEIITADNVQAIGERIATKLLNTIFGASGNDMIKRLFNGLIVDRKTRLNDYKQPLSDGYDIAQAATAFLCAYIGKPIDAPANDGTTDKNGNPATILRACFRKCRAYIYGQAQKHYKNIYIDNPETGEILQVPDFWDIPTYNDFTAVNNAINAMNLTARQKSILAYRMRGKSIHAIAKILCVHKSTIQEHLQAIGKKFNAYTTANTPQN